MKENTGPSAGKSLCGGRGRGWGTRREILEMTPRELEEARQRREAEEEWLMEKMDALAWLVGQYVGGGPARTGAVPAASGSGHAKRPNPGGNAAGTDAHGGKERGR